MRPYPPFFFGSPHPLSLAGLTPDIEKTHSQSKGSVQLSPTIRCIAPSTSMAALVSELDPAACQVCSLVLPAVSHSRRVEKNKTLGVNPGPIMPMGTLKGCGECLESTECQMGDAEGKQHGGGPLAFLPQKSICLATIGNMILGQLDLSSDPAS